MSIYKLKYTLYYTMIIITLPVMIINYRPPKIGCNLTYKLNKMSGSYSRGLELGRSFQGYQYLQFSELYFATLRSTSSCVSYIFLPREVPVPNGCSMDVGIYSYKWHPIPSFLKYRLIPLSPYQLSLPKLTREVLNA